MTTATNTTVSRTLWTTVSDRKGAPSVGSTLSIWGVETAKGEFILLGSEDARISVPIVEVGAYWSDSVHSRAGYHVAVEVRVPAHYATAELDRVC